MSHQRMRLTQHHFRRGEAGRIKPMAEWPTGNRGFYEQFRAWLRAGGYSQSAVMLYSVAARLALGLLDKPYWLIKPESDWADVRAYLEQHYPQASTRATYQKGLTKLTAYLQERTARPKPPKPLNWAYHGAGLPDWLLEHLRAYLRHCQRGVLPEQVERATQDRLSHTTLFWRWLVKRLDLTSLEQVTPQQWEAYLDERLSAGIKPITLNGQLSELQAFLRFVSETGQPICRRLLGVEPLRTARALPRDVPLAQLQQVYQQIEQRVTAEHTSQRRFGLRDRVWFLLMVHSGLRTGEVRRLRLSDVNLTAKRIRIEQSKGLKDRLVYLSPTTVAAIEAYLPERGEATTNHVLLFRHQPLSVSYCSQRLRTYSQMCGLRVTPHQLRHSCATLLLNAGTPILTVQQILGHKHIDTTLGYARLYDGTVAADYYRAMQQVEGQLSLSEAELPPPAPAHLLAVVDSLQAGLLTEEQRERVGTLREMITRLG